MLAADGELVFLLIAALTLLVMQAGFAFRQLGGVRRTGQADALVAVPTSFAVSILTYVVVGYGIAHGFDSSLFVLFPGAKEASGYEPVRFFLLLALAAAVPAIIVGAVAERARFWPQLIVTIVTVGLIYPFYEGIVWFERLGVQRLLVSSFGAEFHDFSGSVTVHAMAGWMALVAVMLLGPRIGRYTQHGDPRPIEPSSLPFLTLGTWMLIIAWFSLNVINARESEAGHGVVAVNALLAIVGGVFGNLITSRRTSPLFVHHGALAGVVAICAAADLVHPIAALVTGVIAGVLLVVAYRLCQLYWKADDVIGVWAIHGFAGTWGGLAGGIFGQSMLGGRGGISFVVQLLGTLGAIGIAVVSGFVIYGALNSVVRIRLSETEELQGTEVVSNEMISTRKEEKDG